MPAEGRKISNIVMMGMGEPLYNFEESVKQALLIASDGDGLSLSKRRITLSTSGVVPEIVRAGDEIGVMLAISLHAVRRRSARHAGADQQEVSAEGPDGGLPPLSRPLQRAAASPSNT